MTKEQFDTLAVYESYFDTAVNHNYSRYPGTYAIATIGSIMNAITGEERRYSNSCSVCVLNMMKRAGKMYFAEKAKRGQIASESTTHPVKRGRKAKNVCSTKE